MNKLHPPLEINSIVETFCKTISEENPFFVEVIPDKDALANECFPNVEKKIQRENGEIIYGWQIWIWPEVFIEAEFHGIWKSEDDYILDITPKIPSVDKILFLPDKNHKYEGFQVKNRKMKISDNGVLDDYFECFDALHAINNNGDRKFKKQIVLKNDEAKIIEFLVAMTYSLHSFIDDGNNRNSICFCNSNVKYKRCCGENIRKLIEDLKLHYSFDERSI